MISVREKEQVIKETGDVTDQKIKDLAREAVEKNPNTDDEQLQSIVGANGKGVYVIASVTGRKYFIKPCSLKKMPDLMNRVKEINNALSVEGNPVDIMSANDNAVIKAFTAILKIGIPDASDDIADEFSLGDMPKVFGTVLDINDFLAGMRTVYQ